MLKKFLKINVAGNPVTSAIGLSILLHGLATLIAFVKQGNWAGAIDLVKEALAGLGFLATGDGKK